MSLFKERASNAKKVIALQNQIFTLKNQLNAKPAAQDCSDCKASEEALLEANIKVEELLAEVKSLKADLKKSKSEVTKLNKKIASLQKED